LRLRRLKIKKWKSGVGFFLLGPALAMLEALPKKKAPRFLEGL
jgi:hypothetical protein